MPAHKAVPWLQARGWATEAAKLQEQIGDPLGADMVDICDCRVTRRVRSEETIYLGAPDPLDTDIPVGLGPGRVPLGRVQWLPGQAQFVNTDEIRFPIATSSYTVEAAIIYGTDGIEYTVPLGRPAHAEPGVWVSFQPGQLPLPPTLSFEALRRPTPLKPPRRDPEPSQPVRTLAEKHGLCIKPMPEGWFFEALAPAKDFPVLPELEHGQSISNPAAFTNRMLLTEPISSLEVAGIDLGDIERHSPEAKLQSYYARRTPTSIDSAPVGSRDVKETPGRYWGCWPFSGEDGKRLKELLAIPILPTAGNVVVESVDQATRTVQMKSADDQPHPVESTCPCRLCEYDRKRWGEKLGGDLPSRVIQMKFADALPVHPYRSLCACPACEDKRARWQEKLGGDLPSRATASDFLGTAKASLAKRKAELARRLEDPNAKLTPGEEFIKRRLEAERDNPYVEKIALLLDPVLLDDWMRGKGAVFHYCVHDVRDCAWANVEDFPQCRCSRCQE